MTTTRQPIATQNKLRLPGVLDGDELVITHLRYKTVGPVVRFATRYSLDDDDDPVAEIDVPAGALGLLIVALRHVYELAKAEGPDDAA